MAISTDSVDYDSLYSADGPKSFILEENVMATGTCSAPMKSNHVNYSHGDYKFDKVRTHVRIDLLKFKSKEHFQSQIATNLERQVPTQPHIKTRRPPGKRVDK